MPARVFLKHPAPAPPIPSRRVFLGCALGFGTLLALPTRLGAWAQGPAAPPDRYPAIIPSFPHLLHGGDWNPDQWLHVPGILEDDLRLMEKAACNTFSVGIFAWSTLEPEEGRFNFEWLDKVMDGLAGRRLYAFLATPSGAKPRWMSDRYEEVRRIDFEGRREAHGSRHNHCFTSPVYREKVRAMNARLAERYGKHPALAGWHISNEYSGSCYCNLCLGAFRAWLRARYRTLDAMNQAWWAAFWSQAYQSFDQVDPRHSPADGLLLDWDRFVTHQTVDFMKNEVAPLRAATPALPVTTNMMWGFDGLDYWRFAEVCDRISWDAYPQLHGEESWRAAVGLAFNHDTFRTMKAGRPFILMESTPSNTNWQPIPVLKKPGQHHQEMMLAVGHGADATMYFQWRKGRGAYEKFHGAVVDHEGSERTRVFQDVAAHGARLQKLDAVVGTTVRPQVALVHDWEARWALKHSPGPRRPRGGWSDTDKEYVETALDHYRPFWKLGVPVDVIESLSPFDRYRLVVAPMLFMLKPGVAERLKAFVQGGGTLLLTYLSGVVGESGLVWRGGLPGDGLRALAGIWAEEIDSLYPNATQRLVPAAGNGLGLGGEHPVRDYCERIHLEGAQALVTYQSDFYAGTPALTRHRQGSGQVYYLAARPAADAFHDALAAALVRELKIERCLEVDLPEGVTVQRRGGGGRTFLFLHNLKGREQALDLGGLRLADVVDGRTLTGRVTLPAYASLVLEKARG
jgi:beta-galactosidase